MFEDHLRSAQPEDIRDCIIGIKCQVPLLDGSHRTYINFDNAASTPVLREVKDTVDEFIQWYASVHRGAGFKSRISTHAYERSREIVSDFVGADTNQYTVVFGKNSTEAINLIARLFPLSRDDVVLVSMMEHHSNDLPFRSAAHVVRVACDSSGRLDEADFERKLAAHAGRVKLVAISGASNVTGFINPLHRLARKAHSAGAHILVDGAQLAPNRPIHMGDLEDPEHLDYLAISAHKMYAPFGIGALVARRDALSREEPVLRGGGTVNIVTEDWVEWTDPPYRFEAGTPNAVGAVALAAACKALNSIGMQRIAEYEAELTAYALQRLQSVPGIRLYGDPDPSRAWERLGIIPFNLATASHFLVAAILSAEYGIGVRSGCFCAHPYILHLLGLSAVEADQIRLEMRANNRGNMPGMVRVSLGIYNTCEEIDILIEALTRIAGGEYKGHYTQDPVSGEYHPAGWHPRPDDYFRL